MKFLSAISAIAILCCALSGCNRASQNKEAIREGVIEYISGKVNVPAMEVDVTSVAFKGAEADATVSFRAKGAPAGSGMEMRYTLEQKNGKWVVKDKAESGGSPHGAPPHGTMPAPGGAQGLPPGHPSVDPGEGKR